MVDERIGTEVAGFQIRAVLGHGGMGTVYLAEQSSPRRRVALKLLRPDLSSDEAFRRRFEHESEAAASTEHPNIVPIYASGESDGVLFIAMRYVEGSDLRERIARDGTLPADRAVEIVTNVAAALDAAHRRGLVHRDVKPGNVLLDEHGNAYLTDFGLIKRSEVSSGITKTGQFMGSIEYCAPEQIRGEEVDGRSDVYSLACVLYECVAGRPPFRRDTEIATLYAHLEQEPPRLPASAGTPPELDRVLATGMAKRPSERYGSAGELAREARHAVGVESGERGTMPSPPRRRWVWGAVAAALLAAIVGVVALVGGGAPEDRAAPTGETVGAREGLESVVRLDPETGELAEVIGGVRGEQPTVLHEGGIAAGEGGVWVGNGTQLQHVDPLTGAVRQRIDIGVPVVIPAVGFRTVWVSTGLTVERINPATDQLLSSIRLPRENEGLVGGWIAIGEDAVWAASSKRIHEIDPIQGRVVNTIEVGSANGLAVGAGAVWVIDGLSGSLIRFDPIAGEMTGSVDIPGSLDEIAVGASKVWVLDAKAGVVTVVDVSTLSLDDTRRVGGDERAMVFGFGALWLADGADGTVTRIDAITLQVSTFDVGGRAIDVSVDAGTADVWVLVGQPAEPRP